MPKQGRHISNAEVARAVIATVNKVGDMVQALATKVNDISSQVQVLRTEVNANTTQVALLKAKLDGNSNKVCTLVPESRNSSNGTIKQADAQPALLSEATPLNEMRKRDRVMRSYNRSHNQEEVLAALFAQLEEGLDRNNPAYQQLQQASNANNLGSVASLDCVELLKVLLDTGMDVNMTMTAYRICGKQFRGRTMLHFAADAGSLRLARLLVARGANVNVTDGHGNTPLLLAVKSDKMWIVKWLLDHGAEVSSVDDEGMTPLHWAVRHSRACVVRYLVQAGVDTAARDCQDKTAYECCEDPAMQRYLSKQPQ